MSSAIEVANIMGWVPPTAPGGKPLSATPVKGAFNNEVMQAILAEKRRKLEEKTKETDKTDEQPTTEYTEDVGKKTKKHKKKLDF